MSLRRTTIATTCFVALAWTATVRAESPDATVRRVAAGLASQQPQVVWEALPPSYQRDVSGLLHDFAGSLDPAVHAKAVAVAAKAVTVLRAKRDLILGSQIAAGMAADRKRAEQGWDSVVGILDTLVHSELADLGALRRLDVGAFLRTTGGRLMQQAAAASKVSVEDPYATSFKGQLEGLKVEVITSDADTATVRITPAGKPSQDMRLVRVEERWVPAELADDWQNWMTTARAHVAAMATPETAQDTSQMLMGLGMIDGLLDQLAAMQTPQELDAALQGLMAGMTAARQPPVTPAQPVH